MFFLKLAIVWVFAALFFIFLRRFGVELIVGDDPMYALRWGQLLILAAIVGVLSALMYGTIEITFDRPFFQKRSYARIIFAKIFITFFAVKVLMSVTFLLISKMNTTIVQNTDLKEVLSSKTYWVFFMYFVVVASLITLIRMVNQKFGPGVLWNIFTGKYRNPREEQRVFMFLDLKASTSIAEKLGHLKYSEFIQDCFADLSPVVSKHKVEIYQYVGDEAVLSWPVNGSFEANNCIQSYFEYMDVLESKSEYYANKYGEQPIFKAGIHLGKVIVAEVGLIKREIAYHGDVLNTTARIQSRCNHFQERLLVSDELLQNVSEKRFFQSEFKGEEVLKGKKIPVAIHGIRRIE